MKNKDKKATNSNTCSDVKEYMLATLSILSQKHAVIDTCPEPEELAAFCENRLRGRRRKNIIIHLNDCDSCRRDLQMIGSVLEETAAKEVTWVEKIVAIIKNMKLRRAFASGGIGLALATCLLLVFFIPRQSDLSKMISNSYGNLSPADIARYNSFVSRGGDEDMETPASDALLAYEAGIAAGKAHLLSQTEALEKMDAKEDLHALLYAMGQWAVVLQCACISPGSDSNDFWAEQEIIASKIKNELQRTTGFKNETDIIMRTMGTIQVAIKKIRVGEQNVDGCEEITMALEMMKHRFY